MSSGLGPWFEHGWNFRWCGRIVVSGLAVNPECVNDPIGFQDFGSHAIIAYRLPVQWRVVVFLAETFSPSFCTEILEVRTRPLFIRVSETGKGLFGAVSPRGDQDLEDHLSLRI
jgi:hypothetical protein